MNAPSKPHLTVSEVAEIRTACSELKGAPLTDDEVELVDAARTLTLRKVWERWGQWGAPASDVVTSLEQTPEGVA